MSGPQLTRGGRQVLDWLDAELVDADAGLEIAEARAIANPHYAIDQIRKARELLARVRREYPDKMRPFLERQAPQYDQQLAELDERVKALEEIAEIVPKVTPFPQRREASGGK